jgi:hypothetical protein
VDRLLVKRPLVFMTRADQYLLPTGESGAGYGFDAVGTAAEQPPLLLASFMSYDEMQLAALVAVSTPTHFVNPGGRANCAHVARWGTFEGAGVYVAQVGARFERACKMEFAHMVVTTDQNRGGAGGYGPSPAPASALAGSPDHESSAEGSRDARELRAKLQLWAQFYGLEYFPTYAEAEAAAAADEAAVAPRGAPIGTAADATASASAEGVPPPRFVRLSGGGFLDMHVYRRRARLAADVFLADANARGAALQRPVYGHLVGLGLGVWQVSSAQGAALVQAYADALAGGHYPWVRDLDFAWFPADCATCGGCGDGGQLGDRSGTHAVNVHFSRRDPAALLSPGPPAASSSSPRPLVVAQYAWDANAWPGNEYWLGSLAASGDPAAACCSTVGELQNPHVNPRGVSATNARVVVGSTLEGLEAFTARCCP